MIRVLHTSDWHLGSNMHEQKRTDEFMDMLSWMMTAIHDFAVDVLVIAGDIFDVSLPPVEAQKMFYDFLADLYRHTACQHVVVIAGNHDSGQLIDMPRSLLAAFHVHVIGTARNDVAEEVELLFRKDGAIRSVPASEALCENADYGSPELIVCAVPFLREADVRMLNAGESVEEREDRLAEGIAMHYRAVADVAANLRAKYGESVPVLATGHLFASGGKREEDDHVRDIVGNLHGVSASIFSEVFDYVALGHLHLPQTVGCFSHIRYSGAPLPMGFDEAHYDKLCNIVTFEGCTPHIEEIPVNLPEAPQLRTVEGDKQHILSELHALKNSNVPIYLRVRYTGETTEMGLRMEILEFIAKSKVKLLKYIDEQVRRRIMQKRDIQITDFHMIDEFVVFEERLKKCAKPEQECEELRKAYKEIVEEIKLGTAVSK